MMELSKKMDLSYDLIIFSMMTDGRKVSTSGRSFYENRNMKYRVASGKHTKNIKQPMEYHGNIMGISWEYDGNMMGI